MDFNREWERNGSVGTVSAHAYFIPFATGDKAGGREQSSRFIDLNGEWEFKAHKTIDSVKVGEALPDRMPVPGCVQMYGYDTPQYTNVRYPFPYAPPYIYKENPAFHYRRTFDLRCASNVRLVFEGVDSCFYVFVNGVRVGFSQVSHRISEFDLTGFAKEGLNVLDVVVLKWCAGSYLEDQDKWRFTGIFRDVYLLARAAGGIEDYKIDTDVTDGKGVVRVTLERGGAAEVAFNGETRLVKAGETAEFTVEDPRLWSAECPELYPLELRAAGEVIYEQVGIRRVKIENGVFTVNGKAVKLHGVNRHDFHPSKGAAVSAADMRHDLELMKAYNVNALRTSHYPSAPELYRMADEIGLYVMSETDIECHGVVTVDGDYKSSLYNTLAESDLFTDAILERNQLNYAVNKNRPCVVMWSLGNEAGYGKNFVAASHWLHSHDSRPVHYEQHVNIAGTEAYYSDPIDVASRMYPTIEHMREMRADQKETRPIVLCEYCHAMGNGPGDLVDYWALMNSDDRFAGGFIWEWADHGLEYKGKKFLYGSDFPNMNDGNFCIDGLFAPDRAAKPGCDEMRAVYADVRFVRDGDGYAIENGYFFKTVEGTVAVTVKTEGKAVYTADVPVTLAPGARAAIEVPQMSGDGYTAVYFNLSGNATANGFFTLEARRPFTVEERAAAVKTGKNGYSATYGDVSIAVDNAGRLTAIRKNGVQLLARPLEIDVARAPIDNDKEDRARWKNIEAATAQMRSRVTADASGISARGFMAADCRRSILDYEITYAFTDEGLKIDLDYQIPEYVGDLARVGLRFAVPDDYGRIRYLAYEGESYIDKHAGYVKDVFEKDVDALYVPYVRPQECSSRYAADFFELIGEQSLSVTADKPFSFSVLPFSREQLEKAKHDFELKKDGRLYVHIDERMAGVGSHACGPVLDDKYRVKGKGRIRFLLRF